MSLEIVDEERGIGARVREGYCIWDGAWVPLCNRVSDVDMTSRGVGGYVREEVGEGWVRERGCERGWERGGGRGYVREGVGEGV